jgi:hypothetical protein
MIRAIVVGYALVLSASAWADRAEELKREGLAAAQHKDWELARQKFEASYAADPRPLTLYNLAAAQENTGRLIAAKASYATFVEKSRGDNDQFRKLAKQKLADLESSIPRVQVKITGFPAGVTVELDGRALATAELAKLAVDPGEHTFVVLRDGAAASRKTVAFARGARETVELTAPPPPLAPRPDDTRLISPEPTPPVDKPASKSSVLGSPWFWGITAVIVVGAAAGGYYVAFGNPFVEDPTKGTLGTGVIEVP